MSRKNRRYEEKEAGWPWPEIVMNLSVVLILVGMLLIYDDFYYNILVTKYRYYCICALGAVVLCLLASGWQMRHKKFSLKGRKFFELFDWVDVMVLAFTAEVILSTLLSPFKWEALWGNEGRYTGAFLLTVYGAHYFCMTRCYNGKAWHIEMFLIAGMLMCLFGITDAFDMDLLGFKEEIVEEQRFMFTSTIGNINTYTACVAMVMAVASVLFATCRGIVKNIWYGACTIISFVALITGISDNAYLSLAMLFGFLPLYLFRSRRGAQKYVTLLAMFVTVVYGVGVAQEIYADTMVPIKSLFTKISAMEQLPALAVVLWAVALIWGAAEFMLGRTKAESAGQASVEGKAENSGKAAGRTKAESAEQVPVGNKTENSGKAAGKARLEKAGQAANKAKLEKAGQAADNLKQEKAVQASAGEGNGKAGQSETSGKSGKPGFVSHLPVYLWWCVIGLVACAVLWVLYDVNIAGHVEKYAGLENYLLFNDHWGTSRGFAWRIAIENYREFPLTQKIFGYGPDTFSLITFFNNYDEMTSNYGVLFDSVHNEYLQYLVTVGPVGLLFYLGIMATMVWDVVKRKLDDPTAVACMFAVLCYGAQATVNINQPIATPIMWTLLCVAVARGRKTKARIK